MDLCRIHTYSHIQVYSVVGSYITSRLSALSCARCKYALSACLSICQWPMVYVESALNAIELI